MMIKQGRLLHYRPAEDFLADAEQCDVIDEVFDFLEKKDGKNMLNDEQLRRQKDWNALATQVVGSESQQMLSDR